MIDVRDHLDALQEYGELVTVDEEIDWNLEAAALAAMSNRTGAQAIHFKMIKGYPEGYTLAANLRRAGPPLRLQAEDVGKDSNRPGTRSQDGVRGVYRDPE